MMRNFIRRIMGKKPVYRVKAWNVEHVIDKYIAVQMGSCYAFPVYEEYWKPKEKDYFNDYLDSVFWSSNGRR